MGLRLFGHTRPGIGHLDNDDAAFAPPSDADLIARRIARATRLQRLCRITRDVDEDAEQLIVIRLNGETAFHRHDPADRHIKTEAERLVHLFDQRLNLDCPALGRRLLRAPEEEFDWQNAIARSRARMSLGAKRCTFGSGDVES